MIRARTRRRRGEIYDDRGRVIVRTKKIRYPNWPRRVPDEKRGDRRCRKSDESLNITPAGPWWRVTGADARDRGPLTNLYRKSDRQSPSAFEIVTFGDGAYRILSARRARTGVIINGEIVRFSPTRAPRG